jgi:hypothetical protein
MQDDVFWKVMEPGSREAAFFFGIRVFRYSGRRREIRKSEAWIRERIKVLAEGLLERFCRVLNARFWEDAWAKRMAAYRKRPERFAREVLGSSWWSKQREAAELVAGNRRVAVKSANGVGKTYLAADLALWFLYSHRPSIVLTTAPTWRQVRYLLWEEIRRRFPGGAGAFSLGRSGAIL